MLLQLICVAIPAKSGAETSDWLLAQCFKRELGESRRC